jgi:hypothetical protein
MDTPTPGIPPPPTTVLPAPWKGLNTVDALAEMDPSFGISIQNFIATPQGLSLRNGYRVWATGLPGACTSLMPYAGKNATSNKLIATSVSGFYDVTSGGTVGAAVVSGLNASQPYWQSTMMTFSTSTVNYMMCVNGINAPRLYDGTTWTTCTQVASPSTPGQFTTVDNNGQTVNISTFVDVITHQERLWFVANNSTVAYFMPIAQAGGALSAFDFGPLFPRGGYLFKLSSWTMDTGNTVTASLVAISSRGDVAVYQGNNPATAATWTLLGNYIVGSPIGRRCTVQLQGDTYFLSTDGLYPFSKYLQSARVDAQAALTYEISPTISSLGASFQFTPGFEMCVYPAGNILMLNVPQSNSVNNFQFCYETTNQGWTQFNGWPAQCFQLFNDSFYFGSQGQVNLGFSGFADGASITGVGGNNIVGTALQAFTDFGVRGLKHIKAIKPYVVTGQSNPMLSIGINTDFNLVPIVGSATINAVTSSVWDTAVWDSLGSTWVGSLATYNQWQTPISWPGEYIAIAISISAVSQTQWMSTNIMFQTGNAFG